MSDSPIVKVETQLDKNSHRIWQEYASVTNAPASIALERLVLAGARALYAEFPNLAAKRNAIRKAARNRDSGHAVFTHPIRN